MTDKTLLTELSAIWDDANTINVAASALRARIAVLRQAGVEDGDVDGALEAIDYTLLDVTDGLIEGQAELADAVDFDELEPKE